LSVVPQVPVDLRPPDISPYRRGNTGVDYVHEFNSGCTGPTVLVQALVHGNEFCGALALDWLLRRKIYPAAGTLIVAFANVAAYARFDFDDPHASRFVDEDYNRIWAKDILEGDRTSVELRRARQLRPFVDRADFLLDIHSTHVSSPPIMMCGMTDKHVGLARNVGTPADLVIDEGHPGGARVRDFGAFNDPASPRHALLIECGQHWQSGVDVVARDCLLRFLAAVGSIPIATCLPHLSLPLPARQRVLRVTETVVAQSKDFKFLVPFEGLSVVEKRGTPIARDGDIVWLAPYDGTVLVQPSEDHVRLGSTQARFARYDDRGAARQ